MSQPDTFVIVDGNSLMHRAFHALPPLSNEDGVFTNAVFGFLSMLFKVIGDEQPRYLAVAFDLHGPTFRHTDYSEYKAGRKPTAPELKPQFDLVRECLTKMGIKILTCPTFEADDILGTFARRCEEAGIPALLVTGDRDSMQLVTETSSVLYTRRGVSDVVRYTPEKVHDLLKRLWQLRVIRYIPSNRSPLLYMDEERLPTADLYISPESYQQRRKQTRERFERMLAYATAETGCRSSFLEAYFGVPEPRECGICDLCLARKRAARAPQAEASKKTVLELLRNDALDPREIVAALRSDPAQIAELLRKLSGEGKISILPDGKVTINR